MTTTQTGHAATAARLAPAGAFLQGLADQDFAKVGSALTADAQLRALLPKGLREWTGGEAIGAQFGHWFGDTEDFELVEATAGEVGGRLHLRWRLRLRAERLGPGWFTVEQQAYADAGEDSRLARLDLVCTGYRAEGGEG